MKGFARVIAFYLPQFHSIPENDEWWGKGFTEWTNVRSAKPLFRGHVQPKIPGELGYYNLLDPEIRERQADLARYAGIEGFCYWHYWFGNGKQLLEKPFDEVLSTGKPDYPFCLGWANHTWSRKTWTKFSKNQNSILIEQEYPGDEDIIAHFNKVLPAFKDPRYITVDSKPLFLIWDPMHLKDQEHFITMWNELAKQNGLSGIHFVGLKGGPIKGWDSPLSVGFDAVCWENFWMAEYRTSFIKSRIFPRLQQYFNTPFLLKKYQYKDLIKHYFTDIDSIENVYPTILPNYDRSPRGGKKAVIYYGSTPELFQDHVSQALKVIENKNDEHKILFLRSWNEWGEGNYIEPDEEFGRGYLDVLHKLIVSE
ncbi:MAG: glycoside hydrolase family 99-like domain-containing protein [Bacteroidales bacterium]|nr:glycoside hydrolase family 99-like domain-containing protein [Bacteroidales bacterium]